MCQKLEQVKVIVQSANTLTSRRQTKLKHYELTKGQSAGTEAAAGVSGWTGLTSCHAAEKHPKLAVVIATEHWIMTANFGMPFKDGLTGSAMGDWALYAGSPGRTSDSELDAPVLLGSLSWPRLVQRVLQLARPSLPPLAVREDNRLFFLRRRRSPARGGAKFVVPLRYEKSLL